jgi:rod shape-determining protein MreC
LGIIDKTSNKYARVLSILSKLSKINATIKHSNHLGSITWNGKSLQTVQLEDISKFVNVTIGDTIVTGGQSAIFPSNIPIGVISKIKHSLADTYDIDVALFNDMTNIETVYIIKNTDKTEIKTLEGNE